MRLTLQISLAVTLVMVIGLSFGWIHFRNKGLARPISPVRHAFFDADPSETKFLIAFQGARAGGPPNSIEAFEAAAKLGRRVILWTDVQMTADGVLVAFEPRAVHDSDAGSNKQTLVPFLKLEELRAKTAPAVIATLRELLAHFRDHRFILNIRDYRPGMDVEMVKTVDDVGAGERILIQSEQDGFLRDGRAARAAWLFGSSQAQITQLLMLIPFALEPMAPLKADVYVTPAIRGRTWIVNEDVVAEIHRRNRKVFAGPVESEQDVARLLRLGVDGVITPLPEAHVSLLK